jgi:hypothetical protein
VLSLRSPPPSCAPKHAAQDTYQVPTRVDKPWEHGSMSAPALVIGRFRQFTGHMEIVAYGTKGAVANSHELCTWIEYVPGYYTMFGSCDAVSSVGKGHPVNVGLEAQITPPKRRWWAAASEPQPPPLSIAVVSKPPRPRGALLRPRGRVQAPG